MKQKITKMGQLEFRITADPDDAEGQDQDRPGEAAPPTQKDLSSRATSSSPSGCPTMSKEFGPVDQANGYVKRMAGDTPEILVLIDPMNVTGDYLTSATKGIDETRRAGRSLSL